MFYPFSFCNQFCSYSKYCIIHLFFNAETCTTLYTCHCNASCIFFPRFHFHTPSRRLCLTSSPFGLHFKLVKLIAQMYWYLYIMLFVFSSHSHNWPSPIYLKCETFLKHWLAKQFHTVDVSLNCCSITVPFSSCVKLLYSSPDFSVITWKSA